MIIPNVIDAADQFREVWEMDDDEFDPFDDIDEAPAAPAILTPEKLRADQDARRAAAVEYLNSDDARREVWQKVTRLPATLVAELLADDTSADEILKFDTSQRTAEDRAGIDTRRELRTAIRAQYDGLDAVEIAHARGDALHDFDATAKILGCGQNWSDQRNREGREKRAEQKAARGIQAQRVRAIVAGQNQSAATDAGSTPTTQTQAAPQTSNDTKPAQAPEKPVAAIVAPQIPDAPAPNIERALIARFAPSQLAPLLKGLSAVKKRALEELLTAKIEQRSPQSWINGIAPNARRELDRRIELAWMDAAAAVVVAQKAHQERKARESELRAMLRPFLQAAFDQAARTMLENPGAGAQLRDAVVKMEDDFDQTCWKKSAADEYSFSGAQTIYFPARCRETLYLALCEAHWDKKAAARKAKQAA